MPLAHSEHMPQALPTSAQLTWTATATSMLCSRISNDENRVHLNQGGLQAGTEGQFAFGNSFGVTSVKAMELGDLDGDGDVDAFVSRGTSTFNALPSLVFLNDGTGTFTDSGQSLVGNVGQQTRDLKLGDVDNDGDLDAFLATFDDNEVFLNDGSGLFTDSGLAIGGATGYDNYAVALGDVDGDGYLDAFAGGGTNKLWINDPDFAFTSGVVTVGTSTFPGRPEHHRRFDFSHWPGCGC